jgi:hypothetical protein
MSERTVLEWEEYICNGLPAVRTKQGKKWDIHVWGGTKENPVYALSVSGILIIQVNIPSIEIAKRIAQELQHVLDGNLMETIGELVVIAYQRGLTNGQPLEESEMNI